MRIFCRILPLATLVLTAITLHADDALTPPAAQPSDDSLGADQQRALSSADGVGDGTLATVMNAFLRAYAGDKMEWRVAKDLKLGIAENSTLPDGWQKAKHPKYGWFAFRPKTYDMLSLEERRAIIRDVRFPQFIAQMRVVADGKNPPLSDAMKLAANAPATAPDPTNHPLPRAEVIARLLEGRKAMPDTFVFDVSANELLAPGRMIVTIQPDSTP